MTLPERIERAVRTAIDPMEEMPFLADCPVEDVAPLIEEYLATVQAQLLEIISRCGDIFLQLSDAAGLCATCLAEGIDLPPDTLLRTCQAIVRVPLQRNEYVADLPTGEAVYMVAMEV
jgi:hypothetical protein